MANLPPPFTALPWTPGLAAALGDAMAVIARLDARVSASSLSAAWTLRASWQGYATALRLQQFAIEEIDIIAARCGLRLAGREPAATVGEPMADYPPWLATLAEPAGRHWREDLPFTFDLPEGWGESPALARALALLDAWARADTSIAPWLGFPAVLHRMGIITSPLPCLVAGDAGQRFALDPRPALFKRLLKQLCRTAEDGLDRLQRLETVSRRSAAAIAAELRPGKLLDLGRLCLGQPCLAARSVAPALGVTISGAGKLLERAARLGIVIETSGRETWRSYVAPDVAAALGLVRPDRGRPKSPPPPSPSLSAVLADFDREMAEIQGKIAGHMTVDPQKAD